MGTNLHIEIDALARSEQEISSDLKRLQSELQMSQSKLRGLIEEQKHLSEDSGSFMDNSVKFEAHGNVRSSILQMRADIDKHNKTIIQIMNEKSAVASEISSTQQLQ